MADRTTPLSDAAHIDPCSAKFDPVIALGSDLPQPPSGGTFDTVEQFEKEFVKKEPAALLLVLKHEPIVEETSDQASSSRSASMQDLGEKKPERLVEPKIIKSGALARSAAVLIPPKQKLVKNVIFKMESGLYEGPMGLLTKCVSERLKVCISTRARVKVRSYCSGYIRAFDKHWNIAMEDVDETYLRPWHVRVHRSDVPSNLNVIQSDNIPSILKYKSIDRTGKRFEQMQRHLNNLFIKGDNIILIRVLKTQ